MGIYRPNISTDASLDVDTPPSSGKTSENHHRRCVILGVLYDRTRVYCLPTRSPSSVRTSRCYNTVRPYCRRRFFFRLPRDGWMRRDVTKCQKKQTRPSVASTVTATLKATKFPSSMDYKPTPSETTSTSRPHESTACLSPHPPALPPSSIATQALRQFATGPPPQ